MRTRLLAAVAALALAAVVVGPVNATAAGHGVIRLGRGAEEVWIFPAWGRERSVVVFGHGWSTLYPSAWMAWIDHLRATGNTVIYPRYEQTNLDTTTAAALALQSAIVAAFHRLGPVRVPVVAVGKSFAGGAIFAYASEAHSWGVPAPAAVLSIFPAEAPGETPPRPLAAGVFVEILVGDHDTVVGDTGAQVLWSWLAAHPAAEKRYVLVRSVPGFSATHASPQLTTPQARAAFWARLDAVIAGVRSAR